MAIDADVTQRAQVEAAVRKTVEALGQLDILVCNAGVVHVSPVEKMSEEEWDLTFAVNAKGVFLTCRAALPELRKRPEACIINIASVSGLRAIGELGIYGASKAALIAMTRSMAHEWARHGIAVNAICPGYIETEMNSEHWDSERGRKLLQRLPRKRLGKPADLDELLLLLASDPSGFINGAVITVDDGFTAG